MPIRFLPVVALFLLSAPAELRSQATPAADTARALHLLSRATFGVRAADLARVLELGPARWLEQQLAMPAAAADVRGAERFPAAGLPIEELVRRYSPPSAQERAQLDSAALRERTLRSSPQRLAAELVGAKLQRAAVSERQLEEVMTDFWFNHFNVFFGKGVVRYLVSDYERTAIRPHVFGSFEDMLLATARHPAMLFYLDNWQSVAVDSPRSGRAGSPQRPRGLNENYARELLELHTLGVGGGYTQEDVIAVARAFTGWTFLPPRPNAGGRPADVRFSFRPERHDRGEKLVLGHTLRGGRGEQDGRDVLHLLAVHPATAAFLARKLVARFVSDAGDAALERELAAEFTRTGGDLRAVTRLLFSSPRFYAAEHRGSKLKTPLELVVSALRVAGAEVGPSRRLVETLRSLGQLPYGAPEPTGFPVASEEWVNAGAMLARMNFGLELAAGRIDGVRPDLGALLRGQGADRTLERLAGGLLPGRDTQALQERVRTDLAQLADAPPRTRAARAAGLLLGSPEFQRR